MNEQKDDKVPLMTRVPQGLREQIETLAREERRSLSAMTEIVLERGIRAGKETLAAAS